jgi:acyl-CoA reductase-like NAD-dependent aldehyde dehydrogenase
VEPGQPAAPRARHVRVQAAGRGQHGGAGRLLSSEHGKVIADAKGDIQRGLEVIEFACGIPHALKGEYTTAPGPASMSIPCAVPLGVCAGITPFNFPP